jgi:hypothetical protein
VRRHGTKHGCANLADDVTLWATPNARDVKNPSQAADGRTQRKIQQWWTIDLGDQSAQWATASARDWKSGDASEATMGRNARPLNEQACHFSPPAQVLQTGQTCWCGTRGCGLPSHKRKLNALFVTVLMGWPRWWLIPAPMPFARREMEQWLSQARRRLESF